MFVCNVFYSSDAPISSPHENNIPTHAKKVSLKYVARIALDKVLHNLFESDTSVSCLNSSL